MHKSFVLNLYIFIWILYVWHGMAWHTNSFIMYMPFYVCRWFRGEGGGGFNQIKNVTWLLLFLFHIFFSISLWVWLEQFKAMQSRKKKEQNYEHKQINIVWHGSVSCTRQHFFYFKFTVCASSVHAIYITYIFLCHTTLSKIIFRRRNMRVYTKHIYSLYNR